MHERTGSFFFSLIQIYPRATSAHFFNPLLFLCLSDIIVSSSIFFFFALLLACIFPLRFSRIFFSSDFFSFFFLQTSIYSIHRVLVTSVSFVRYGISCLTAWLFLSSSPFPKKSPHLMYVSVQNFVERVLYVLFRIL